MIKSLINISSKIKPINKYYSGIATILMLHRVHPIDTSKLTPNENMKVSPEFLENFITSLKAEGYDFISINTLYKILRDGKKVKNKIIFTLDDGYKDNYDIAYPIFKKHKIPFTLYITTSFPNHEAILWWYILEDIIIKSDSIELSNGKTYTCKSKQQKDNTFLEIRDLILTLKQSSLLSKLQSLFIHYDINWLSKCKELSLTWSQIRELSRDDLVTIAGHTKNHYALNKLSNDEIKKEVTEANLLIESMINKKVNHFSYPFGSKSEVGQSEIKVVDSLNLKTSTTTRKGNIYPKHKQYLSSLPRIMLTENFKVSDLGKVRKRKFVV